MMGDDHDLCIPIDMVNKALKKKKNSLPFCINGLLELSQPVIKHLINLN